MNAPGCSGPKPHWTLESVDFYIKRVTRDNFGLTCPFGYLAVNRAYNNGFPRNDSNHRYTTSDSTWRDMGPHGLGPRRHGDVLAAADSVESGVSYRASETPKCVLFSSPCCRRHPRRMRHAPATSDEPRDEVVYQTGSNLPKKYKDPAQTTVDKDRAMERSHVRDQRATALEPEDPEVGLVSKGAVPISGDESEKSPGRPCGLPTPLGGRRLPRPLGVFLRRPRPEAEPVPAARLRGAGKFPAGPARAAWASIRTAASRRLPRREVGGHRDVPPGSPGDKVVGDGRFRDPR